jgi:hypothetical protein
MEPDDLYGLPLEQFIPRRGALVKALRQDGDRERAKEVAALRKPSVAAWAVNQLVRSQTKEAKELFEAGDALQHAQSELLEGRGDGNALREAVARERDAVDALAAQARGLLSADGHELTASTLEKVSDTLHAAALDPGAREQVQDGRLERELRHVGMGEFGGALTAVAPGRAKPAQRTGDATTKKAKESKEAKEAEQAAERERAAARKAARQAERDARRAAERAERELQASEARREKAAAALAEADDALAGAREQAERTAQALEAAEAEVNRLSD